MGCLELTKNIQNLKQEIFLIKDQLLAMPHQHDSKKNLKKYLNAKTIECDHMILLKEFYKTIDSKTEE